MNKSVKITFISTAIFPRAQHIPKGLAGERHHSDQKNCYPVAQCSLWTKHTVTILSEPSSSIPQYRFSPLLTVLSLRSLQTGTGHRMDYKILANLSSDHLHILSHQ